MVKKKTALSGVQPTGNLHIGNYLGAIVNWLKLQEEYQCIFFVANLHALTVKPDPKILEEKTREIVALYLASGLDPEKCIFFVQSHVREHAELAWILSCVAKMGELERMTQYKDKSNKNPENINAGLFIYPALMAADILLYQTDVVPVGEDQTQHLEIARTLANRFNNWYGKTLEVPEMLIQKEGNRIMSLLNPESKMSKTDANPKNYLYLLDRPDEIRKKIASAVTDSDSTITYDPEKRKAVSNLIEIYHLMSKKEIIWIENEYKDKSYSEFKADLAEVIINVLRPLQDAYDDITRDVDYVDNILKKGAEQAWSMASKTMKEVKEKIGLI